MFECSSTIWLSLHSNRSFLPIPFQSHWALMSSSHSGISDATLCKKKLKNHIIWPTPESLKVVLVIQYYHWPLPWACFPVDHPSSGKFTVLGCTKYKFMYFGRATSVLKDPSDFCLICAGSRNTETATSFNTHQLHTPGVLDTLHWSRLERWYKWSTSKKSKLPLHPSCSLCLSPKHPLQNEFVHVSLNWIAVWALSNVSHWK